VPDPKVLQEFFRAFLTDVTHPHRTDRRERDEHLVLLQQMNLT
jgi:hypothetical protein